MKNELKTSFLFAGLLPILMVSCFFVPKISFAVWGIGDEVHDPGVTALNASQVAQGAVSTETDVENKIKEWGLDTVAYNVAGALSTKLTNSIVNWANGGFNGAPAFVQDFGNYFKQQGDQVLGSTLGSLQGISQSNPFARDLALQLINGARNGNIASLEQGLKFNLDKIVGPNWQQFYTNPGVGGWDAWNAIAQPQNNPVGSLLYVNNYVANKTADVNENTKLEALGGGGFLNIKKCTKYKTVVNTIPSSYTSGAPSSSSGLSTEQLNSPTVSQNPQDCLNWETQTPGSTIKSSLDKALGVPQDRLTAADEFKEILSASLTSLITGLTNAGLNKLVGSFTQQPFGSLGGPSVLDNLNSGGAYNWLNLPGQIVDIDEQQQIVLPDGSYAINRPCVIGEIIQQSNAICI